MQEILSEGEVKEIAEAIHRAINIDDSMVDYFSDKEAGYNAFLATSGIGDFLITYWDAYWERSVFGQIDPKIIVKLSEDFRLWVQRWANESYQSRGPSEDCIDIDMYNPYYMHGVIESTPLSEIVEMIEDRLFWKYSLVR